MVYSIYKVENIVNGKIYIGFTCNFEGRKSAHINLSKRGSKTKFHRALQKYGINSFNWEIIFQGKKEEDILNWAEPYFISEYNSFSEKGYNMTSGGENGAIQSEEVRRKRKESLSGDKHPMYGRNHREESKRKMSISHSGENNSRSKKYIITSPNKEIFIIIGEFDNFCKTHKLSKKKMKNYVNKGIIQEDSYSHRTQNSSNCVGWEIREST